MKITKFGQCCLLIEVAGKRILTDPGKFSTAQNDLKNIDLILITHEHADHLHTESLEAILKKNPGATVVTNGGVGRILEELAITHEVLEGEAVREIDGLHLGAHDGPHAEIFEEYGQVQNTGYFIAETLFYPGDAYTEPGRPVPVLALPIAGPWCKVGDALRYALKVNPKKAFPVHDALLNTEGIELTHGLFENVLGQNGIEFIRLQNDETKEL
jgi:L-ascorbate metabolism protein UlaG (beta-lactamase superfamily)